MTEKSPITDPRTDGLTEEELREVINSLHTQFDLKAYQLGMCFPRTSRRIREMIEE